MPLLPPPATTLLPPPSCSLPYAHRPSVQTRSPTLGVRLPMHVTHLPLTQTCRPLMSVTCACLIRSRSHNDGVAAFGNEHPDTAAVIGLAVNRRAERVRAYADPDAPVLYHAAHGFLLFRLHALANRVHQSIHAVHSKPPRHLDCLPQTARRELDSVRHEKIFVPRKADTLGEVDDVLHVRHAVSHVRCDIERDGFLRLAVEPPDFFCEEKKIILAFDRELRAADGRPRRAVVAVFVPPAEAEVRLVDGVLAGLAARLALCEGTPDKLAVLVDRRTVPAAAERRVIRDALREIFISPVLPVVVVVLAPVIDGICRVLFFGKKITVVLGRGVRILRRACRTIRIVRLLRGEIAVDIRIVRISLLRLLVHEVAVDVVARNVLERNRARERHGLIVGLVVCTIVRIVVVPAAPDGAHEPTLDRRAAVRPVRDVDDALLLPALDDVERIASQEHVDLPVRQARRPAEERRDEILVRHAAVLVVLRWDEIIAIHVDVPIHRRRNLLHVVRDERLVDADINGRVQERVAVVHSLHALHEVALRCLFHEKAKMVVEQLPLDRIPDVERLDSFELERVGKRQFAKCQGKRADAELAERFERMVRVRGRQAVWDATLRVRRDCHAVLQYTARAANDRDWHGDTAMCVTHSSNVLDERSRNVEIYMYDINIPAGIERKRNVVDAVVHERPRRVKREFCDWRDDLALGVGFDFRQQRTLRVCFDAGRKIAACVRFYFCLRRFFNARDKHRRSQDHSSIWHGKHITCGTERERPRHRA